MYVEKCVGIKDRGNIIAINEIPVKPSLDPLYVSLWPFDASITKYVEQYKTVSGHKGKHYCNRILIDVDYSDSASSMLENLKKAKESTEKVINRLYALFQIMPDQLNIYFSGKKGFHVEIREGLFSAMLPDENMAKKMKNVVMKMTEEIEYIDPKIFENHRIIRVVNSKNESGLYKILLRFDEFKSWTPEEICRKAKRPRPIKSECATKDLNVNVKLDQFIQQHFKLETKEKKTKNDVVYDSLWMIPQEGERNTMHYKQACRLFEQSNLDYNEIEKIMVHLNNLCPVPEPIENLIQTIHSASSNRTEGKESDILNRCSTVEENIPKMLDTYVEETNKIDLCLDFLNEEFKGNLRGKFGILLGYGGTKKSLLSQCIAFANLRTNNRTIYSTMEMGAGELTRRFFDIYKKGENALASEELQASILENRNAVERKLKETFAKDFGDKLITAEQIQCTAEDYDIAINYYKERYGKVDILMVDGFSGMGGTFDNEVQQANVNSAQLMALAQKHNIFVLAIVHASRGADRWSYDLRSKARGSEKIMDNCSFSISMSLLKGKEETVDKRFGVCFLDNKRGSGRELKKPFELMPNRLLLRQLDMSVSKLQKMLNDECSWTDI